MGELRRDPSIRQELASTHAEMEGLRTLLNEQSHACAQAETPGEWRRLAGQRRETLTKLDVQGLLLRARMSSLNPDASGRQEALRSVSRALKRDARSAEAHMYMGILLHEGGDLDGAIVQYRQVLKIDSNDVSARYNLGTALKDRGDLDGAIVELQKVLQLNPGYADAHYNLGAALAAKGDRPGALREMRDCIRLSNDEGRKEEAREVIRAMGGDP
ncbi:MAG: tetratricopeptide repeat protein [Candidatus Latescibacteria bacterium]|nr:tetratricopeptide repeat protein [Candidatus Latescibacterota bacterium]